MRKFIVVLSIGVFGFAGFTVWNDPTVGPMVKSLLPEDMSMAGIKASLTGETGNDG